MDENTENINVNAMEISNQEITFDNLTILKELSNITNLVSEEEFMKIIPKTKRKHVNWLAMYKLLKQEIHTEMLQELDSMWKLEAMPEKLEILDRQKEKFADKDPNEVLWRPPLGDVAAQLKAHDMAVLEKQKRHLEAYAKEYETRVDKLKKTVSARRGYLTDVQLNIQKYEKKVSEVISITHNQIENHCNNIILPNKIDVSKLDWGKDDILQCVDVDDSNSITM